MGAETVEDAPALNQKPNEPCGCGSGKKFKKCCRQGLIEANAKPATAKSGAATKMQQVNAGGAKAAKGTGHLGGHKNVGGHTGGSTAMR